MPRAKKSQQQQQPPSFDDFPDPADLAPGHQQEEPEFESRQSRKKNRNGQTQHKVQRVYSPSPEPVPEEVRDVEIASARAPLSPPPSHSLLSQIHFPSHGKSKPVNIREDPASTEKVSDQYTPPSDAGLADDLYGRSPSSLAISSAANTPPVEPGFSSRPISKVTSPPISPPQRYARPLSFGGSIPPLPSNVHYPISNYGSPPPHLPQAHFYGAHDVDLGTGKVQTRHATREPYFTKFAKLPDSGRHGIISGHDGMLVISSYDGLVIDTVSALCGIPGFVIDAELLHDHHRSEASAEDGPLVAINVAQLSMNEAGLAQYRYTVSIYSLTHDRHLLDLLTTPFYVVQSPFPGSALTTNPTNPLRMSVGGSQLVISCAKSGEIFVFTFKTCNGEHSFECIKKLWTSIQPREKPRGSSQPRSNFASTSQAVPLRIEYDENVPLLSLSGRWLAICPPTNSVMRGAGMVLGTNVTVGRHVGFEALSPPTRPTPNVEVDSPDVDTLLGKVARGVAQHMMKAGNWLGEQGMQAWQNYWRKEDSNSPIIAQPTYVNAVYNGVTNHDQFPPTHADTMSTVRDPDLVCIYDLTTMRDSPSRASAGAPMATFQPPNGCSFLSFSSNGLMLLTASRKGDYQYVWDLLEMRSLRVSHLESEADTRNSPRIRQIARFDRLSSSVIAEVVWEVPTLSRIALLTKNKTIHLLDIPASAMRWPPPRRIRKDRPTSAPPDTMMAFDHDAAPNGGFLANIASKTSPMLVSLRGRTPSTSGSLAGIGQAGIGIAAATGARGSKAVASGLSKSLGAATDTVSRMHHAGEGRLHLKSEMDLATGRLIWTRRATKLGISILTNNGLRHYQTRKTRSKDARQLDTTVFEARKAIVMKLSEVPDASSHQSSKQGFWSNKPEPVNGRADIHPLSYAEIDTNAPFQPFHSDRRVTMSIIEVNDREKSVKKDRKKSKFAGIDPWVFGEEIPATRLNMQTAFNDEDFGPGSIIQRETHMANSTIGDGEQIVSTSRRRKPRRNAQDGMDNEAASQEGFFEDDCDVLDFASDRV